MTEWILILTLNLLSQQNEIRDISPQIIDGFASKKSCELAASKISKHFALLAGKAREAQGIPANTSKSAPSIQYECITITK